MSSLNHEEHQEFKKIPIESRVSGCHGKVICANEMYPSGRKRRARKVRTFGQVVFSSGPNVWRVLWDAVEYKGCAATLLKYEGVGPDLVTMASADGGQFIDYSTDLHPISDPTSTSVERTGAYGGNVTDFSTELHSYSRVIADLDSMGASTSAATANSISVERTRADRGEVGDFCIDIHNSSGLHAGYLPLCHSTLTSASTSNVLVDALISLRQLDPYPDEETAEDNMIDADVLVETAKKERERGEFYLTIKAQSQKNIADLVKAGHSVVIRYRQWRVIGKIRDEEPEDYEHVDVCGFGFKYLSKSKRIELLKSIQHPWDGGWHNPLRKTNYSVKWVNHEMVSPPCLL